MDLIFKFFGSAIRWIFMRINTFQAKLRLGAAGKDIRIYYPNDFSDYQNIHIGNNVQISRNSVFVCGVAKIIIKDNIMIGENVLLVAGNHNIMEVGRYMKGTTTKHPINDKEIVINEDVFIIFNVTILSGVTIGRGAVIGTGAVVRQSVPPYAIVAGNPAKIIGFRFTPKQILEHEIKLYKESERIPIEELELNYKRYYLDRLREIASFMT